MKNIKISKILKYKIKSKFRLIIKLITNKYYKIIFFKL